jgi:anion-transporting  ArsA/GET3 family ATPase
MLLLHTTNPQKRVLEGSSRRVSRLSRYSVPVSSLVATRYTRFEACKDREIQI